MCKNICTDLAVMSSPIHSPWPVKKLIMTGLSSPSSPLNSPKMPSSPLLFSTSHPHTGTTPSPSSSPLNSPNVVSSPLSFRPPTPPSPFSSPMKSPRMISSPLSSGSALTRSPAQLLLLLLLLPLLLLPHLNLRAADENISRPSREKHKKVPSGAGNEEETSNARFCISTSYM